MTFALVPCEILVEPGSRFRTQDPNIALRFMRAHFVPTAAVIGFHHVGSRKRLEWEVLPAGSVTA